MAVNKVISPNLLALPHSHVCLFFAFFAVKETRNGGEGGLLASKPTDQVSVIMRRVRLANREVIHATIIRAICFESQQYDVVFSQFLVC